MALKNTCKANWLRKKKNTLKYNNYKYGKLKLQKIYILVYKFVVAGGYQATSIIIFPKKLLYCYLVRDYTLTYNY